MFTYLDAAPWRPSLEQLFDDSWRLMPQYQVRLRWASRGAAALRGCGAAGLGPARAALGAAPAGAGCCHLRPQALMSLP